MDFVDETYAKIVLRKNLEDLGDRRQKYVGDYNYLHKFMLGQGVDFRVVRADTHETGISPYLTLKESRDVPIDYLPSWLRNPRFREKAVERIGRIREQIRDDILKDVLEHAREGGAKNA